MPWMVYEHIKVGFIKDRVVSNMHWKFYNFCVVDDWIKRMYVLRILGTDFEGINLQIDQNKVYFLKSKHYRLILQHHSSLLVVMTACWL